MPIAADVLLGDNVQIHHRELVNLYGCRIGSDTKIGVFVEIQKGVIVGSRCKISSHTFVCEGVTIEDDVFVGHGVMFINDRYPRARSGYPSTGQYRSRPSAKASITWTSYPCCLTYPPRYARAMLGVARLLREVAVTIGPRTNVSLRLGSIPKAPRLQGRSTNEEKKFLKYGPRWSL